MRINEVEALVGVTKKNIRFYEQEGLLAPGRNKENGYREYSQREVDMLKRIKLLRKLGLPLEEIRRMQAGHGTVSDAMHRHLVTLERERSNVEQAIALCEELCGMQQPLDALDADAVLARMEGMEQGGTQFCNKQKRDVRRFAAPATSAALMVALMAVVAVLIVWACALNPEEMPPPALVAVLVLMPLSVAVGVVLALKQRWRELKRGEEDEAKQY